MHCAEFTPEQADLLRRFNEQGGVVEFVIVDLDQSNERIDDEATHRRAAILGLHIIRQQVDEQAVATVEKINSGILGPGGMTSLRTILKRSAHWLVGAQFEPPPKERPITRDTFFRIQIDQSKAEAMRGPRIAPNDFMGVRASQMRVDSPPEAVPGFAFAVLDPPHGHIDPRSLDDLVASVVKGITSNSTIFAWPTDWSNYSDAGREWWGSFLWTVANPDSSRIVVIAASSTD
jgi:hypothetical protein